MEARGALGTGGDIRRAAYLFWGEQKVTAEPNCSTRTCDFCLFRLTRLPAAGMNWLLHLKPSVPDAWGQIVFLCLLSAPSQFRFEFQPSL